MHAGCKQNKLFQNLLCWGPFANRICRWENAELMTSSSRWNCALIRSTAISRFDIHRLCAKAWHFVGQVLSKEEGQNYHGQTLTRDIDAAPLGKISETSHDSIRPADKSQFDLPTSNGTSLSSQAQNISERDSMGQTHESQLHEGKNALGIRDTEGTSPKDPLENCNNVPVNRQEVRTKKWWDQTASSQDEDCRPKQKPSPQQLTKLEVGHIHHISNVFLFLCLCQKTMYFWP